MIRWIPGRLSSVASLLFVASGCSIGGQASVGLTVDTEGTVGAEVRATFLGLGMASDDADEVDFAAYLFSFQAVGGYDFGAGPRFSFAPGIGLGVQPGGPDGIGLHGNFAFAVGLDAQGRAALGPSLSLSVLPVVGFELGERNPDRPEWPAPRSYHGFGGTFDATLRWAEDDLTATFFLGPTYQFTTFFSVGL